VKNLYRVTVLETHLRTVTRAVVAESMSDAELIALGLQDGEYVELADEFHESVGDKDLDDVEQVTAEDAISEVLGEWPDMLRCVECGSFEGMNAKGESCGCAEKEAAEEERLGRPLTREERLAKHKFPRQSPGDDALDKHLYGI
jgi:hypothetical protein